MILFVHIPKTAGTSFGKALSTQYGHDKIWYDYGLSFEKTADAIAEYVHKKNDLWTLKNLIDSENVEVISGHYPALRYQSLFTVREYCTFFRDPIQRVYSEFCHRRRRSFDRFEGSFEDYCKEKKFCNVQSRLLKGSPWSAYGFYGITELYEESLELFDSWKDVSLERVVANKNKSKRSATYFLTEDEKEIAIEANRQDVDLYNSALAYFEEKLKAIRNGCSIVNGQVSISKEGRVTGFAFYSDGDMLLEHVQVEVLVNGKVKASCLAKEYRKNLHLLGVPKHGYVGFSVNISFKPEDVVSARVVETGQFLAKN